jgi:hypothetical protein
MKGHADVRHKDVYWLIDAYMQQHGIRKENVWYSRSQRCYYFLCQLDDGRWAFKVLIKDESLELFELTSYVQGSGSWEELERHLKKQGARQHKSRFPLR